MSAEEDRTKENATVLAKVSTAAFPAEGLAPWMSDYDKRTEAVVVGTKWIADVAQEVDRRQWMSRNPGLKAPPSKASEDEPFYEESKARGGSGMVAFTLNRLSWNIHNHAPSIDGRRTRQAIALAKANNPGMATQPGDEKKPGLWDKMKSLGRTQKSAT